MSDVWDFLDTPTAGAQGTPHDTPHALVRRLARATRTGIEAQTRSMHEELDPIKERLTRVEALAQEAVDEAKAARLAAVEESRAMRTAIDELPARFSEVAFEHARQDREDRRATEGERTKLRKYTIDRCFDAIDKLASARVFQVLFGIALVSGVAGLCLNGLDFRAGEWLNFSARTSRESAGASVPVGPMPEPLP